MSIEILYFLILLLIIFSLINLIKSNLKYSPKKIKMYITILGTTSLLSYISIIILPFLNEQGIVLYFMPLVYFKYISVLLMLIPIMYIFFKEPNINFNLSYIIMGVLILIYIGINVVFKAYLDISQNYGFVVNIYNESNFSIGYIGVLGLYLFACASRFDTKYGDRKGIYVTFITVTILVIEMSLKVMEIYPFPYTLVGDTIIVLMVNYCINILKKGKGQLS